MPLYLVATPIGNLEDITLRALRVLREADAIACEDTRHTLKLLNHFEIKKPLISYFEHNERRRLPELIRRLQAGESIALVSDAGTPALSDPGYPLVREAVAAGIPVIPVPGPCAALAALTASGLPTDRFLFVGFLPDKPGPRRRALETVCGVTATLVFYVSPYKAARVVADARAVLGDRAAVLARELTKLHETFVRVKLSELAVELERRPPKGELVLLVVGP